MADNVTVDNGALTDYPVATDVVTYSGDAGQNLQLMRPTHVAGAEDARTVEAITQTVGSAAPAAALAIGGTDGTNIRHLKLDASGEAQVDVLTLPNVNLAAGTNTNEVVGDVAHDSPAAGNPVLIGGYASAAAPADVSTDADVVRAWMLKNGATAVVLTAAGALIPGDASNGLDVDVTRVPTDPYGANADAASSSGSISAKLRFIAATGIPVTSLPASTNTIEVVGDIAHDTGVSGNPVQIAGAAQDCDDTAPPNRISTESDVTRFATDRDGSLFVRPHGPQVWSYHVDGSSALTDATVHSAPGAGLSLYVTDIIISLGAATALNVFFEEGASKVLGPYYLEAVNGRGLAIRFATPKKITANTALTVTSSAAVAHAIDVMGFTAQG